MRICSPRKARRASIACIAIFIVYTFPHYLYSNKVNKLYCVALHSKGTLVTVYSYVNLAVSSLIPFTIILILNVLIINSVRNRFKYFKENQKESDNQNKEADGNVNSKARESQLVILLLLVTFSLLILTLPQYVRYVVYLILNSRADPEAYATYILVYNITQKLYFTNSMCNFFLYAIGGSKFRQDVKDLFCRRSNSLARTNTNSVVTTVTELKR